MVAVRKTASKAPYLCYLIVSSTSRRTYVGITNNFQRRLRQHNGELVGGASATRIGRPWSCYVTVEGFPTKQASLQFEWMWKHMSPKKSHGRNARLTKLENLLKKERWTEQAPLASSIPLTVTMKMLDEEPLTEFLNIEFPEYVSVQLANPDELDEDDDDNSD